jgi:hypothetical protein
MNYLVQQTGTFLTWHASIRDLRAKVAIARRIDRASAGNLGDIKPVGDGISEMRVALVRDTGFTSRCETVSSSSCWQGVTNHHKPLTSDVQKKWHRRFNHEQDIDYLRYGSTARQ